MSSADEAESSSRALERFLAAQLDKLNLNVPDEEVEFIARFVEEEGIEREDKVEGVRGMLEGIVDGGILPETGLDEALNDIINEHDRLETIAAERAAALSPPSPEPEDTPAPAPIVLSEKEIAKLHAMRYAYEEVDPDELAAAFAAERGEGAPPRGGAAAEAAAKRAAEERKALIAAAIRLDGKKKKYKKGQEVDLMAPNLNRDKVNYQAQMQKEAQKNAAQTARDRDKAALEKQRADIAKAKADKQKKAQKQERRG